MHSVFCSVTAKLRNHFRGGMGYLGQLESMSMGRGHSYLAQNKLLLPLEGELFGVDAP